MKCIVTKVQWLLPSMIFAKLFVPIHFMVLLVCSIPAAAQQSTLSFTDAYTGNDQLLTAPLPVFVEWKSGQQLIFKRTDPVTQSEQFFMADLQNKQITPMAKPVPDKPLFSFPPKSSVPVTSPDRQCGAYVRNNNIFLVEQKVPTVFAVTADGNDSLLNGVASYVYQEEITGANTMRWSNNSQYLAFMQFDESNVPVYSLYVTDTDEQHGRLEKYRYPKSGQQNPKVAIGIFNRATKKTIWADFDKNEDQYFGVLRFSADNKLIVKRINRGQDHITVFEVDPLNGNKKLIYEEKQSTWLNINNAASIEWIDSGRNFILQSDKSGYSHFYLCNKEGKFLNAITSGEYEAVDFLAVDESKRLLYFSARKENTGRFDIYSIRLDGTHMQRITKGDYHYTNVWFSPDFKYFVANYSNTTTITISAVFNLKGEKLMDLGNARGKDFNNYVLPRKSFIRVKSTDGLFDLPVTITFPLNFDSTKQYPVLMTVYGGPYLGKVYDNWSISLSEIYWAQQGVIQVAADNRSSGHFGKKGMNFIHRQLGIYEIEDFMAVGKWLKQQPWVHPSKLCITGFSFGGYMTLMALTYGADVFDFGVAYYGVSDHSQYDTQYSEMYMDSPAENPEGYKKTAVLTWLPKYKGMLRIIHGNSDQNVHPQHSLEVVNALEEQGKHFEFILYPGIRHGFRGKKWLHSKQELAVFINKYLLGK